MKRIFQTLGIILATLICFIPFYFEELMDFRDLKAAGYVSVEPVRMWAPQYENEPVYVSDYRIEFLLETESGGKYFDLSIEQAYDTEDYVKGLKAYKKKKPVEGYVYYSENSSNAYFSKTAETSKALIKERLAIGIVFIVIINFLFILPLWIPLLLNFFKVTKLPKGYQSSDADIVCTYHGYTWSFLMLMSGLMTILIMIPAIAAGFAEGNVALGMAFILLSAAFGGLTAFFWFMMKNWILVIYRGGFIYRTSLNKLYRYQIEDIQNYSIIRAYRNHSIYIKVKDRKLWLNYYCTNYYKVEKWLAENVKEK